MLKALDVGNYPNLALKLSHVARALVRAAFTLT